MDELKENNLQIENMIYEIRGKQVMLDSDLAKLYQVETKRINEAVKRNKDRFPEYFCFQLTELEILNLRSQNATSSLASSQYGGRRYLPYAFTEQGVAMLSSVLKSDIAVKISIRIINAFVSMRKYIANGNIESQILAKQINENKMRIDKNDAEIRVLQESFKKFEEKKVVNEIYYNGQIYDAYSKILDIFKEANHEIIVVDGYADKVLLDIIRNLETNVKVKLITFSKNTTFQNLYSKYQKQYSNLKVVYDGTFHDRYFILDDNKVYHCGTSINHAGSKTFSINLLEDDVVRTSLINHIKKIIS